jgi:DNA invertase Pin-like site-specific DNA recombinase
MREMRETQTALRAVLYGRVSKKGKGSRQRSVGDQQSGNREACAENAWQVVAEYADDFRSASRFATKPREEWTRVVEELETGQADVLVMWESSRGDRELEMWARFLNTCRRVGALIHVTSHGRTYDVRVARDWRTLAEDGVDNAYESEKTHERIVRTVARTAAAGLPHGRILYGYRREHDRRTGAMVRQVVDDTPRVAVSPACPGGLHTIEWYTRAGVIREIAERVLAGRSLYWIAGDLNTRGIPTPRSAPTGWATRSVKVQITNPGYIGRRVHRGEDIGPAAWPALLDEDDFYACVARLTNPSRLTNRDGSVKHLLTGLAVCGECKEPMKIGKNRGVLSYSCWRRAPRVGPAFHTARRALRLDTFIEEVVWARLAQPDTVDVWAIGQTETGSAAIREASALRERLASFYAEAEAGRLSAPGLARIESGLLPQIERLEARARSAQIHRPTVLDDLIVHSDVELVAAVWRDLHISQRREVLRFLIERVEVMKVGRGRTNYDDWEHTEIVWRGQSSGEAAQQGQDQAVDVQGA